MKKDLKPTNLNSLFKQCIKMEEIMMSMENGLLYLIGHNVHLHVGVVNLFCNGFANLPKEKTENLVLLVLKFWAKIVILNLVRQWLMLKQKPMNQSLRLKKFPLDLRDMKFVNWKKKTWIWCLINWILRPL